MELGAVKGFKNIHKDEPYIDAEYSAEVGHVYMLYVPPVLRGKGVGAQVFNDWVATLPSTVKRVRLKATTCGGSDGLKFWKELGFTDAFSGCLHEEIEDTLVLGVNGYSNPIAEAVEPGGDEYRHWIEDCADIAHLTNHPQLLAA